MAGTAGKLDSNSKSPSGSIPFHCHLAWLVPFCARLPISHNRADSSVASGSPGKPPLASTSTAQPRKRNAEISHQISQWVQGMQATKSQVRRGAASLRSMRCDKETMLVLGWFSGRGLVRVVPIGNTAACFNQPFTGTEQVDRRDAHPPGRRRNTHTHHQPRGFGTCIGPGPNPSVFPRGALLSLSSRTALPPQG